MKKQFTSQELAEALKNKSLENLTLVYALVKQGDDSSTILICPSPVLICPCSDCENWIPIPLNAVSTADYYPGTKDTHIGQLKGRRHTGRWDVGSSLPDMLW